MSTHNRVIDAAKYRFSEKDRLCLDTNVWLCLFPFSTQKDRKISDYTSTVRKIVQSKATIVTDILILSEYMNRYANFAWRAYENDPKTKEHFDSYKRFRKSGHFAPIAERVSHNASRIVAFCRQHIHLPIAEKEVDLVHILEDCGKAKCDFGDAVIADKCRIFNCKLVTDDYDFGQVSYGIDVITHNSKMLRDFSSSVEV